MLLITSIISYNLRTALINIFKSMFHISIILTLFIFIIIFFLFDNTSFKIFETGFLSPFFYIASYIEFVYSFDLLYENDKIKLKNIFSYAKSIFTISIYSFFLDVLFTMSINTIVMIITALICIFLFIIANFTNKKDYPDEVSMGYDGLIALAYSLNFYIPYGLIAFNFKIYNFSFFFYIIILIITVFFDFCVSIIKSKKAEKLAKTIKIFYIVLFILHIPSHILLNDIIEPTFVGNIAIFIASMISLFIIDLQNRIYHYKYKKQ